MRKPLVAANWKMNGSKSGVDAFFPVLVQEVESEKVEVVVFPPFVYLQQAVNCAGGIAIGAQNMSQETSGAFTGEVSAAMLLDTGCRYVLVGHSERRSLYGEDNDCVARKFKAAMDSGLTPVLCVGESLEEREADRTLDVVESQLTAVIDLVGIDAVAGAVVAYEPVWAIGTGRTASPEQAQEVHGAIRDMLGAAGATTRILYGGSVKAENAAALFSQPDIDGGLVGGASLKADEFAAICGSV
jgi:triosephosphate isomerase (TIM)